MRNSKRQLSKFNEEDHVFRFFSEINSNEFMIAKPAILSFSDSNSGYSFSENTLVYSKKPNPSIKNPSESFVKPISINESPGSLELALKFDEILKIHTEARGYSLFLIETHQIFKINSFIKKKTFDSLEIDTNSIKNLNDINSEFRFLYILFLDEHKTFFTKLILKNLISSSGTFKKIGKTEQKAVEEKGHTLIMRTTIRTLSTSSKLQDLDKEITFVIDQKKIGNNIFSYCVYLEVIFSDNKAKNANFKKISEVYSYIKQVYKFADISDGLKKITFRSQSFRVDKDSLEIYQEIKEIFDEVTKEYLKNEAALYAILTYGDKKSFEKTKEIISGLEQSSEFVRSCFLGFSTVFCCWNEGFQPISILEFRDHPIGNYAYLYENLRRLMEDLLKVNLYLKIDKSVISLFQYHTVDIFDTPTPDIRFYFNWNVDLHTILNPATQIKKESYLNSLKNIFSLKISPLPMIKKNEKMNYPFISIELKSDLIKRRLHLSSFYPFDCFVSYFGAQKDSGRYFLITEKCYPFTEYIRDKPENQVIEYFVHLFNVIKTVNLKPPKLSCIDLDCLKIDENRELKIMIKCESEISEDYKAPEIKNMRICSKSLIYSFGNIIYYLYLEKRINEYSNTLDPSVYLSGNAKNLYDIYISSTRKSVIKRASLDYINPIMNELL